MSTSVGPARQQADISSIERELRVLLRRARAYSTELARSVHPDLDPAVYALLVDIADYAPARAADLAAERNVTKGVISRQVRTLEDLGLVERRPDETDARAHTLVLSTTGRRALRRSQNLRHAAMRRLLAGCTPEELSLIAASLAHFNSLME
ncbi:MarR family winged helix-turn-helix transcriptional regulator [Jatrophihabitans telluris]|uniref:MarR family winged helix-turn-helix transcriptional regulator n=1 Tax=Jatrophihabitans telluris TaxID=2038343 RepID=A0ABY4R1E0_9ACTN|nr:MarR family winged helix-turn-helix transcriptional regulator [Jatrophihabitans telluris]UQX88951.1 MarR family winged helix-turn-helix transcriptional regulator [Jatrophihabitans telluris]